MTERPSSDSIQLGEIQPENHLPVDITIHCILEYNLYDNENLTDNLKII